MHAYLLALEIEPVEVNKVYVALPLHCTVVPWFRSNMIPAEVRKIVSPIAEATPPRNIVSGRPDMFGEAKDVPVNRLVDNDYIVGLHHELYAALEKAGIQGVVPQWTGDGFTPHVTRQRSGRFEEGRRHTATRLYLVEAMVPDQLQQKKVIDRLFLRGTA